MTKRVDNIDTDTVDVVNEKEEAEAALLADEAKAKNLLVYHLNKPINAYGQEVKVIKMRRPTGKDLVLVGNPVIYSPHVEPVRIEHDLVKIVMMVARISTDPPIPSKSLEALDPNDLIGLAWSISPFFIPAR